MNGQAASDDYRSLLLNDVPLIDLRAPTEYLQGAFPTAVNLPLMSDDERAQIGLCYKRQGQQAAIDLGHKMVSGELRDQRLQSWKSFIARHPEGYLYCFRGGLRSQTVQRWLHETGIDYPLVSGGYKALRRYLLDQLVVLLGKPDFRIVLVSGATGTGKTRVIEAVPNSLDLEGLARHRGSSFGALPQGQPSQIDFENQLIIALLKMERDAASTVFIEDEGRLVGRLYVPELLREKMASAPMVVVEQTVEERVDVIVQDYVVNLRERYLQHYGNEGLAMHQTYLFSALEKIKKRLGGLKYQQVNGLLADAFDAERKGQDSSLHRLWVEQLLVNYYDPMYQYQLQKRSGHCLFKGSRDGVIDAMMGDIDNPR